MPYNVSSYRLNKAREAIHFTSKDSKVFIVAARDKIIESLSSNIREVWLEEELDEKKYGRPIEISNQVLRQLSTLCVEDVPPNLDTTDCESLNILVTRYSGQYPLTFNKSSSVRVMITKYCLERVDFDKVGSVWVFTLPDKIGKLPPSTGITSDYIIDDFNYITVFGMQAAITLVRPKRAVAVVEGEKVVEEKKDDVVVLRAEPASKF